jgi:type IV secretory pathway TraG/TraD family ATPase VirD4
MKNLGAQKWGRSESLIWPPQGFYYSYGAVFLSVAFTGLLLYLHCAFSLDPLARYYLPIYLRSELAENLQPTGKYQLLFVLNDHRKPRPATPSDVILGSTPQAVSSAVPLALSALARSRGARFLWRENPRPYMNQVLHTYLQKEVYGGLSTWQLFDDQLWMGLIALALQLPFSIRKDMQRKRQWRYGRRLKGPLLVSPKSFSKALEGDGIGLIVEDQKNKLRIPRSAENKHILTVGDTGAGKSTIIRQILMQVAGRNHCAIVYDPACEFIQQFFNERRGDIVLNPLDTRCPYWSPSDELQRKGEAKAIAASLFQPAGITNRFFVESPQKIFAHLLSYLPTPCELVHWMSHPEEIDRRVQGTELATIIDPKAPNQRTGVLGSLNMVADSFRLLPRAEETTLRWTATAWAKERRGWIFITSRPALREALLPLISLWLDLLVLRLLTEPHPSARPVWFVIDELASLQRLPQLHTAITENRKSNNPIILGFQGRSQLEARYGHDAEAMLSQPATKIFLRTSEPRAAKWVSEAIGEIEIERLRESHSDGSRAGKTFSLDRQTEPLVLPSEVSGLDDLRAYLKYGNYVTQFAFPYIDLPQTAAAFLERKMDDLLPVAAVSASRPDARDEARGQPPNPGEMDFNSEYL